VGHNGPKNFAAAFVCLHDNLILALIPGNAGGVASVTVGAVMCGVLVTAQMSQVVTPGFSVSTAIPGADRVRQVTIPPVPTEILEKLIQEFLGKRENNFNHLMTLLSILAGITAPGGP